MEEFQQAAVTGSWELEVARERFGPWAEERADFECFGTKSANKFRARAKGNEGRPNAESLDGIVGLP